MIPTTNLDFFKCKIDFKELSQYFITWCIGDHGCDFKCDLKTTDYKTIMIHFSWIKLKISKESNSYKC